MREQLRKALDQVSLIPTRECGQKETAILFGAIGLELYAAYSKLIQMEVEFSHAQEYLDNGQQSDVEETMQMNSETLADMGCKFGKRSGELMEQAERDREFREPISVWLQALAGEMKRLEEYRIEDDAAKNIEEYLAGMRGIIEALREYLGFCIGNTAAWEKR